MKPWKFIIVQLALVLGQDYDIEAPLKPCTGSLRPRPSIYAMSDSQWKAYSNAIQKINDESHRNKWGQFAKLHADIYSDIHSKSVFLAWHRAFLFALEQELQKIDPSVMIPYWDWTYYSQAPEKDPVFDQNRFGGDGALGDNQCVDTGSFGEMEVVREKSGNATTCIKRRFDKQDSAMTSWLAPELVNKAILKATSFEELWHGIETGPHGVIHNSIGADFSDHASPADPLFFSHHAFVDKLWFDWQTRFPDMKFNYTRDADSISNTLKGFNYTIDDVLSTYNLCYYYEEEHFSHQPDGDVITYSSGNKKSGETITATKSNSSGKQGSGTNSTVTGTSSPKNGNQSQSISSPSSQPSTTSTKTTGSSIFSKSVGGKPKPLSRRTNSYDTGTPSYNTSTNGGHSLPDQNYSPTPNNLIPLHRQITPYQEMECDSPEDQADHDLQYVTAGVPAPPMFDREDQVRLRIPRPLPVSFINKMGYDIQLVRQTERRFALCLGEFNSKPDFVSSSALGNLNNLPTLPPVVNPTPPKRCRRRTPALSTTISS